MSALWIRAVLAISLGLYINGQVLTPPYFNPTVVKNIEATATCGYDVFGKKFSELYCHLTGGSGITGVEDGSRSINSADARSYVAYDVMQRQICDYCNPLKPNTNHRVENAVDGTERWWQSPPLSRGLEYNHVNITINLGQVLIKQLILPATFMLKELVF